jgi:hypothetical protein
MKRIHVGSRVRIADGMILNAALRWSAERRAAEARARFWAEVREGQREVKGRLRP